MNVSELFGLTNWINAEIVNKQIPQKYQSLFSVIQQNIQPNVPKQPFEVQKDDLIQTLKIVPLDQLSRDQLDFLRLLGIAKTVGVEGIEAIEEILYKNIIDIATSAQKIQIILQGVSAGIAKSNQLQAGLTGCVIEEEYLLKDEILMRVSFTGHASMTNVTDFKKWGDVWFDIGRGIAMAHNLSPEDVKVVGATKGSIVIELAVVASIASTASGIILGALKVAEKILDLRKKAEEIRGMKLLNDKLANEIANEADNEKKAGIEVITSQIAIQLNVKADGEGDKVKALNTAVRNLVNFIENGGVVDFVIPEDEAGVADSAAKKNGELRVAFQEIRQLEKKIALIENKKQT